MRLLVSCLTACVKLLVVKECNCMQSSVALNLLLYIDSYLWHVCTVRTPQTGGYHRGKQRQCLMMVGSQCPAKQAHLPSV